MKTGISIIKNIVGISKKSPQYLIFVDTAKLLRIHQWLKNLFIFVPLFFTSNFFNFSYFVKTALGFGLFSLAASSGYIFNDVIDADTDRLHPFKNKRPIAAGKISRQKALIMSSIIITAVIIVALYFNTAFAALLLIYYALSVFYSLFFKKIIFLDLVVVSVFFVLRVFAGAVILDVPISNYLLVITFLLAMFIVAGKRIHDKRLTKNEDNFVFKSVLFILTTFIIVSYFFYLKSLYLEKHMEPLIALIISFVFVIFGLTRFIILLYSDNSIKRSFDSVVSDKYIFICVLFWLGSLSIPFYFNVYF